MHPSPHPGYSNRVQSAAELSLRARSPPDDVHARTERQILGFSIFLGLGLAFGNGGAGFGAGAGLIRGGGAGTEEVSGGNGGDRLIGSGAGSGFGGDTAFCSDF